MPAPVLWSSRACTITALRPPGRYQKRGSGRRARCISWTTFASRRCCSSACGMATRSRSTYVGEEEVVRPDGRRAVALGPGPRRVALARVDDRARQVVRERGRVPAGRAHAAQRDRGMRGGRGRVRVERRDDRGAARRVAVGRRRGTGSSARRCPRRVRRRCPPEVRVGERPAGGRQAQQARELWVRTHGDQVAAAVHEAREQRDLGGGERHLAEDRHVVRREQRGRQLGDVDGAIAVEPFGREDLDVVAAERAGRAGHDQDRSARALVGRRRGGR